MTFGLLLFIGLQIPGHFSQATASLQCADLFEQRTNRSDKLERIYLGLVQIDHEYRSQEEFLNNQEQIAQKLFEKTFPDWKSREQFSLAELASLSIQNRKSSFFEIVKILPLLVGRYKMNGPEVVDYFFTKWPFLAERFFRSEVLRTISLWGDGPIGQKNLEVVVQNAKYVRLYYLRQFAQDPQILKDLYIARLIRTHRVLTSLEANQVYPTSMTVAYLEILSNLPFMEIPEYIRQEVDRIWIQMSTYPPLQSDMVISGVLGLRRSGDCPFRCATFQSTLIHPFFQDLPAAKIRKNKIDFSGDSGDVAIIQSKGQVLGVVKFEGENSFLALRTVVDYNGRIVMAMGGVYALSGKLLDYAHELKKQKSRWTVVEVDQLILEPQSFFFNVGATIDNYLVEPIPKGEFMSPEQQRQAWGRFLNILNEIRVRLEAGERAN